MKSVAVLCVVLFLGSAGVARAADSCDRACLEGMVNQYLKAVVAHDASSLPLAKNVRYTENGQQLPMTQGLWATATGDGSRFGR